MSTLNCDMLSKIAFSPSNHNILVVDDCTSINDTLTKMFVGQGFNCFNAFDIEQAREILKNNKIDYMILDMDLPDGDGCELLLSLGKVSLKTFILINESQKDLKENSYEKGIIDFIIKDDNFNHKIEQITSTIEQLEKNRLKTILIVDDSIDIQKQLKGVLKNRNYQVLLASDTDEALGMIKDYEIDLLLLDFKVNQHNGIKFLQKNTNEITVKNNIPVFIISKDMEPSIIRDGLKAGAVDIIKKPYVVEEIILKVDLWIDYKRKEDEVSCSRKILEEYKDAVDESSIVSKTSPSGVITYVNEQFCNLSGYTANELIGKNHNIVRHQDMPKEAFSNMWHTIKVEKKSWRGKVKNRKKDGTYYWVDALIKPILDKDGKIVEFIGLRKDITEHEDIKEYFKTKLQGSQKDLNESIKLSQEYEKAINESNILSRTDLDGNITYVNDKFLQISGYTKEELLGVKHNIVRHPDTPNEVFKKLWETITKGDIFRGIIKDKKKNGEPYWVDTTIVPIKNGDNKIIEYMAIRHDLTEVFNLHAEIENTQKEVVYKMGEIAETRSKETGQHVKRVAEYSKLLAKLYGLCDDECELLYTASPMHDIGKVGISDSILKKPSRLSDEEFEQMQEHCQLGYDILKGSNRPVLETAAIVSMQHHERYNGKGYPKGLKGKDIHIYGRITAVADVFDALGSDRCYKKAWRDDKIFKLFKDERGEHFDPKLVDLFLENKEKFLQIRERYSD